MPTSVLQVWFFIDFWSVFCVKEKKFTFKVHLIMLLSESVHSVETEKKIQVRKSATAMTVMLLTLNVQL